VAAPPIGLRLPDQTVAKRIQVNIADHLGQIGIPIHDDGLVSSPKERTVAPMKPIEPLRVKPVEVPHHAGEIRLRGAQTDMVVIAHQAIGEYLYSPTIMKLTERIEKSFVVSVFEKNLLPGAATVHHVVDSSRGTEYEAAEP
jgi:hypothetical protein